MAVTFREHLCHSTNINNSLVVQDDDRRILDGGMRPFERNLSEVSEMTS